MKILIIIAIALLLWIGWSIYISRAEQLIYTVIEQRDGYEVREYDPYIAATVTIPASGREGLNQAFRVLAGYIFGGNTSNQSIAMTTPVITQEKISETIAMTTPVLTQEDANVTTMTFSMPKKWTMDTLPTPTDSRIVFTQVPSKKFAVYRFSWYYTSEGIRKRKAAFAEKLAQAGVKTVGDPIFAGYNGPGTIPFLLRNEIMIELAD